jgi:flagellar hook-basal body complex protein FliE
MTGFGGGNMSGLTSGAGMSSGLGVGSVSDGFLSDAGIASSSAGSAAGVPFAGVLQTMIQQTNVLDQKASQAVTGLLNGSGVEIHDAMIATQKADMAFELALQVRNKAVGAYQQMMGMQF